MTPATAVAFVLAVTLLPAPADAARKRPPCGDTSWVVADAPIVPGDESLAHNGIVLRDGKLRRRRVRPGEPGGRRRGTRPALEVLPASPDR
jgi:hypothetical protein